MFSNGKLFALLIVYTPHPRPSLHARPHLESLCPPTMMRRSFHFLLMSSLFIPPVRPLLSRVSLDTASKSSQNLAVDHLPKKSPQTTAQCIDGFSWVSLHDTADITAFADVGPIYKDGK